MRPPQVALQDPSPPRARQEIGRSAEIKVPYEQARTAIAAQRHQLLQTSCRSCSAESLIILPFSTKTTEVLVCMATKRADCAARSKAANEARKSGFFALEISSLFIFLSPLQQDWHTACVIVQNPIIHGVPIMMQEVLHASRKAATNDGLRDVMATLTYPFCHSRDRHIRIGQT